MAPLIRARRWLCAGQVQGVGFRPFVYRLACHHRLQGWVRNVSGQVEVFAQGPVHALDAFGAALLSEAPQTAKPHIAAEEDLPTDVQNGFRIIDSISSAAAEVYVPPDRFLCPDCQAEMDNPHQRRYRYPFINCTQCGPRYTLIQALPYDRARTTMARFDLCPDCHAEYNDPGDHRFHAEPIACPACGPQLAYQDIDSSTSGEQALQAALSCLRRGDILALKGVGGYQLLCDASSEKAVARLRLRKQRPHKPLAVMFPEEEGLVSLRASTSVSPAEQALLYAASRPIVLLSRHSDMSSLAPAVAFGCSEIGAMLPTSPLHRLILDDYAKPLVVTSGNLHGEPILIEDAKALQRLEDVADAFLLHDRPIARPADDPVCRVVEEQLQILRPGRGLVPLELRLPTALAYPVLALGGHSKVTIALGWGNRAVISQHLGDMDAPRSRQWLRETAWDLQQLYGVRAEVLLCDNHPGYATSRMAMSWKPELSIHRIAHHRAHASALAGESRDWRMPWLIFTWDGSGLGDDASLWGGEALLGHPGHWQRAASFRTFSAPGGERVMRQPWRSALALLWETERVPMVETELSKSELAALRRDWAAKRYPRTSSVGRLFDAAASLLGLSGHCSYEGQAAMALEAACVNHLPSNAPELPLTRDAQGVWRSDWAPLIELLHCTDKSVGARAALFHRALAQALVAQARQIRSEHGPVRLGLTGGVFQNRRLCGEVAQQATAEGFELTIARQVPCNDAGLAFGQLIEYAACP